MGINTGAIGYETQKKTVVIDEESVRNYLEAINSVNPFYSKSKYVPPMFNVVLEIAHIQELWESEELHGSKEEAEKNVLMLVHGEKKMIFKSSTIILLNVDTASWAFFYIKSMVKN